MTSSSIQTYYDAFIMSQDFLRRQCITEYPIDMETLIEKMDIILTTVEEYREYRRIVKPNTPSSKLCEIKDGRTIFEPNSKRYMIIYNDIRPYGSYSRIRFTLAHELGHIVLGHLTDSRTELNRGGISNWLYGRYENEADTFAGNLLAPPTIIDYKSKNHMFDENQVRRAFGLSVSAVAYFRKSDFIHWLTMPTTVSEKIVLHNYLFRRSPRYCSRCCTQIFGATYKFCPICGGGLKTGKGDFFMIYERIELKENGKVIVCPNCKNEETDIKGDYCQICGKHLINKCQHEYEDHGEIFFSPCEESVKTVMPGNARFCPYCGSPTTFNKDELLLDWDLELKRAEQTSDFEELDDLAPNPKPPF